MENNNLKVLRSLQERLNSQRKFVYSERFLTPYCEVGGILRELDELGLIIPKEPGLLFHTCTALFEYLADEIPSLIEKELTMTNSNVQKMHTTEIMKCIGCRKKIPDDCTTGCSPIVHQNRTWLRAEIYDCGFPACKATREFASREIDRVFKALCRKIDGLHFTQFVR